MRSPTSPTMNKYLPARETLDANGFVNNPNISESDQCYLRDIQATYKVQQEHWADHGYSFQIMLIWDQDRIWGAFDLGFYKGVLVVDHGPNRLPPERSREQEGDQAGNEQADPIYYDFTWRGTCSQIPDTAINNPLITKGKIEFGRFSSIRGYFEGMFGIGLPDGRCDFDGMPLRGPRRVPRNLQSFIDDWNDLNYFGEDETTRPAPPSVAGVSSSG